MKTQLLTIDDIPEPDKDPEFWNVLQSNELKQIATLLIMHTIRRYDPEIMSNESCRTQLGKVKALQELIDLPALLTQKPDTSSATDELPQL